MKDGVTSQVWVIAGPTASGKTALSVALAKTNNAEIVSADSMQIYRDLSIGTARPTEEEMCGIPHHLIGFVPLSDRYSVAQYAADARSVIRDIHTRGKLPIMCGGTGLYIQSVTENLAFSEECDDQTMDRRRSLKSELDELGGEAMLQKLAELDPETAARLHPNDHGRIVRALEVVMATGVPMSEWIRRSRQMPPPYDTRAVVLSFRDRQTLYDRIDRRVDIMLQNGLIDEAAMLMRSKEKPTAAQAIGYKELTPYLRGEISLNEATDTLKRETRRYAKRQLSWFRKMYPDRFLFVDDYDDMPSLIGAAQSMLEGR